jgi:S1-C subfamily serine protease
MQGCYSLNKGEISMLARARGGRLHVLRAASRALAFASLALIASATWAQAPASNQPNPAVTPATSERAGDILARVRPAVIQIKGFFGSNTAHAFHGTGFAVAPRGIFMTNYHVVAQRVLYPDKYRLEYRAAEGKTGAVNVLAIDVRHDLAVVQAAGLDPAPLKLEAIVPSKGDRAYSIGFPLDVGLTITEGVSNGKVEDSFDPRIHYSGAINGGMSGGPALNGTGAVIGVNVSAYLFKQLVSFLVPAEHAQALLSRALKAKPAPGSLRKDLVEQLHSHSDDLLGALEGAMSTQSMAGYTLPARLAPFINCSGAGEPVTDQPVDAVVISCSANAGLFVQPGLYAGNLRYTHYVLTTEKLDAWRFAQRLTAGTSASGAWGSRQHVGPFACEDQVLRLKGFDAAVLVCVRSYRALQGLYDFTVRVSSLNGAKRGFASHLDMYGLEFNAGMAFIRRYVEAMGSKT